MVENTDYKSDLVVYIKKNLKKGYPKDSLLWALVRQGNSRREVDKAMEVAEKEITAQAPVQRERPKITHEIIEPKVEPEEGFFSGLFKRFF